MNIWISIAVLGGVLVVFGFFVFTRNYRSDQPQKNSIFILGIFIPFLFASFYSETLIEFFPNLTLIDLGAFYFIGMISGFFVALYSLQKQKSQ